MSSNNSKKIDNSQEPSKKVGVWIIGAKGAVASSVILGALALEKKLIDTTGIVTETDAFSDIPLIPIRQLVFGGYDPAETTLEKTLFSLGREAIDPRIIEKLSEELLQSEKNILFPPKRATDQLIHTWVNQAQKDLRNFQEKNQLSDVVVVNLASTEPFAKKKPSFGSLAAFEMEIVSANDPGEEEIPSSILYAYAAMDAGFSYVNFTPSTGADLPALEELALKMGVPHAGKDGKTGETLLKTALAPMFAQRSLKISSWIGYNMLGNGDGKSLSNPVNAASKIHSKGTALPEILGYEPFSHVAIDYVPSIGDWKTAMDMVTFEGFFNTPMSFSFTWRGCDSMLAAPLILDLIRLTHFSNACGEKGALDHLGFFFKDPKPCPTHDLSQQFELLLSKVRNLAKSVTMTPKTSSQDEEELRTVG